MSTLPPWDGDAWDRKIREMRGRPKSPVKAKRARESPNTVAYDGYPRGEATQRELQRRAEVERAMRRRAAKDNKKGGH